MSFLSELSSVQREAVETVNGPIMIIAGAGSGKTRVLTYRVAHLLKCKVPSHEILALTFTNKAAGEMRERVVKTVGSLAKDIWMGTFHSIFARILRKEAEAIGYSRSFTIYDSDDSLNVVKKCMSELGISTQQFNPNAFRAIISKSKNQLISHRQFQNQALDYIGEKVAKVYERYENRLKSNNAMDFDDLLIKPIELFQKKKSVLEKYQYKFKFCLVDEFQDTNRAQYVVTKKIADRFKNICVVGDDAQSIYSFRGAEIRNILDFEKDFPETKIFRLEQNYRSTKTILSAADNLIKYNRDQLKKNLWTENAAGDFISVIQCEDDREEANTVVRNIQTQIITKKLDLKDFAVLYRTNAQSRSIEDEMRRNGIPYVIVGGIRFYERKEIKDVLAYLRLIVNPQDGEGFKRAVNYPSRGIGDVSLEHLDQHTRKHSVSLLAGAEEAEEISALTDRAKKGLKEFSALISKYRKLKGSISLSELSRSLVDELGILQSLKDEGTIESLSRWENVQELLSAITEFHDTRNEASLESFLEEVALVSDIDSWDGEHNAVTLMTLHSSKGLEFPIVFITGLEENLLPFYSNGTDSSDLEEERRLFYVGITRAKQKLFILYTRMRYRFGEASFPTLSRFISELGETNIQFVSTHKRKRGNGGILESATKLPNRLKRVIKRKSDEISYASDDMPDYESESQVQFELKRGIIVAHETFGRGRVLDVIGSGENQKASVDFDDYGIKNLIIKFARLKPIS